MPDYAYQVMYAIFGLSVIIMLQGLYSHLRRYGIGVRELWGLVRMGLSTHVKRFMEFGLGQRKVVQGGSGGVMHSALFVGFMMLLAYTTIIFIQNDLVHSFNSFTFLQGGTYLTLEFLGDILGVSFLIGLLIAVFRRYVQRLDKLETRLDDRVVLGMLIWIGFSGFLIEAFRFLSQPEIWSQWEVFSPVGDALSKALAPIFTSNQQNFTVYQAFWWSHMISVFALIAIVPYTKLIHVFTSGFNVALAPEKPRGRLNTPFSLTKMMESENFEMPSNVKSINDLKPLQLLAVDGCTNCGRCQEVCPAFAAGRDLSPRLVVQDLRGTLNHDRGGIDLFSQNIIRENELWSCTTCNACVAACPVLINQVDYIIDFRRTLVAENKLDNLKRGFLENVGTSDNPFGLPAGDRLTWLTEMGVPTVKEKPDAEYLYWIGCQASYDARARKVAQSVVKILRTAGVSFAILGNDEACTGEPVRRLGEEGKFQELATKNIAKMNEAGVKKVIVHCAHCFNTFLNEYPEFGANFEVIHHSQLISQLIATGKLKPGKFDETVTFHDPCNLGRINGVFDAPREVLRATEGVKLVEMGRNKEKSFCCGGGGANFWYNVPEKKGIGVIRLEEAKGTGASAMAVACPFCISMFEAATKTVGDDEFQIKDIAEIVAESISPDKLK